MLLPYWDKNRKDLLTLDGTRDQQREREREREKGGSSV